MEPRVIHDALTEARPGLAQLSHALWSNPELGLQERAAHDVITAFLEQHGFSVERHAVLPTGFVASYSAPSSSAASARPHVVLLAEYDALPDIGHACGHNLIATAAVGAGLAARAALSSSGLAGRVSVFGTPAEESDGGKLDFIRAGRFADVDAALMVHPCGGQENILLPKTAANRDYRVTFKGKATHAAANPWQGQNALDAAVLAYQNVASRRQQFRPEWRAAGIITRGGTAVNVIPDHAELLFTLRAPDKEQISELAAIFRACMEAAALATSCSVTIVSEGDAYLDVRHNRALAEAFEAQAKAVDVSFVSECAFGGCTDMGNVSYEVPGIHPLFQIGSSAQIHEKDFAADAGGEAAQKVVIEQAEILARTAMEVLSNGGLREAMRKEFAQLKK